VASWKLLLTVSVVRLKTSCLTTISAVQQGSNVIETIRVPQRSYQALSDARFQRFIYVHVADIRPNSFVGVNPLDIHLIIGRTQSPFLLSAGKLSGDDFEKLKPTITRNEGAHARWGRASDYAGQPILSCRGEALS
jgi:hypothetical protein